MTNSKLFLAAACAAELSLGASAANWTIDNGVASVTADCELTESDQTTLDGLTSITITAGMNLYAKSGNTVTIPCPINSTGGYKLGKPNTGTLIITNALNSSVSSATDISFYGAVTFADGASVGNSHLSIATGDNSSSTVVRFNTVFPAGSGPAKMQTRGGTSFAFDKDNVFANSAVGYPLVILGRGTNPAGILDLNGHDQIIGRLSFYVGNSASNIRDYNPLHYITSDTAATLTLSSGFVKATGDSMIFNGRLMGGVSFKLDSAASTPGAASFSNTFENVSATTGSLICARGTINLLAGARFTALSSIRKEGTGNFEISTSVINSTVDLYLDGTGKVTLNNDIAVAHAYTNDTNGGWVMLKADVYDEENLSGHLCGTGRLTVLHDDTHGGETVTYTWTGALGNGTLTADGNWEGNEAPTLDSATEHLVFPATGTSSFRVDGAITVGGITISYPGAFTVEAGSNAQINLGEGGLSVADTTTQTNAVTVNAPLRLLNGTADVTFSVGDGTAFNLAGGISAAAAYGRRLVIDGGALTFGGDSSGMLVAMAITNATSVTVTSASGLGAGGATIYGEMVPYFDGTRTCTSPWTVVGNFPASESPKRRFYPTIDGSPFEFSGAVRFEGTIVGNDGKYKGFVSPLISNNTTFRGGVTAVGLADLRFYIEKDVTLTIRDNPFVRGGVVPGESTSTQLYLRFYGVSATNSFVVTDQSLDSTQKGVIVSQCSLVCAADHCIGGQFTPYVDTRDPRGGDPIWSRFDLAGHSQTIQLLWQLNEAVAKFPTYPDSYVEVTSATPADFVLGDEFKKGKDGTLPSAGLHQLKFTGAASLRTVFPWEGMLYITNTVSTTTGDLEITSGGVEFRKDAGWGGGTNVIVSGAGILRMNEGAKGFAQANGGPSKVLLKLEGGGSIDIPSAGTTVSVEFCETNGVRLARGDYTAATLPDFVTGSGTLHVRRDHPRGFIFSVR